jgi:hypothetical protein
MARRLTEESTAPSCPSESSHNDSKLRPARQQEPMYPVLRDICVVPAYARRLVLLVRGSQPGAIEIPCWHVTHSSFVETRRAIAETSPSIALGFPSQLPEEQRHGQPRGHAAEGDREVWRVRMYCPLTGSGLDETEEIGGRKDLEAFCPAPQAPGLSRSIVDHVHQHQYEKSAPLPG